MCLGVPGRIVSVDEGGDLRMGNVAFGAIEKQVCLDYVPEAQPGEWVLVHVGFALQRIDETEAKRVFEMLASVEGDS